MIVRIFNGIITEDFILTDKDGEYLVGCDPKAYICIDDLPKKQLMFIRNNGTWRLKIFTKTLFHNTPIDDSDVDYSGIYVLNAPRNIAMLCIENNSLKAGTLSLKGYNKICIGRNKESDVCITNEKIGRNHAEIVNDGSCYVIRDLGSINGTYLNGKRITDSVALQDGDRIVILDTDIVFTETELSVYSTSDFRLKTDVIFEKRDYGKRLYFRRAPRIKLSSPDSTVFINDPPDDISIPNINWLSVILPPVITVATAIVMTVVMHNVMSLITVPLALSGVAVAVINFFTQKKKCLKNESVRCNEYLAYLAECEADLKNLRNKQQKALRFSDQDIQTTAEIAFEANEGLWARRIIDKDFLSVRVGYSDLPATYKIDLAHRTAASSDNLRKSAYDLAAKYEIVPDVPVTFNLFEKQISGIKGKHSDSIRLLKNIILQLTVRHSYTELKIVFLGSDDDITELNWIKRIPHFMDDDRSKLYIASSRKDAAVLLRNMTKVLKERNSAAAYGEREILPYYLFIAANSNMIPASDQINEYFLDNKVSKSCLITLADEIAELPKDCNYIIEIEKNNGLMYNKNDATAKIAFQMDEASNCIFEEFGDALENIYCNEEVATSSLPDKYNFYQMLGIRDISEYNLEKNWSLSNITKSISAQIGVDEYEQPVYLDLHETAHGPHGLIIGTTGSGKSEVLLSYILSMALNYSPTDVGFMIIDFKGGAMVDKLEKLPHLRGSIGNTDGKYEISRMLAALNAEIERREKVLKDAHAENINQYNEYLKSGIDLDPLPYLIIIVDEFAEFKMKYPDFSPMLDSLASIGRSLGMLLILATQVPAGIITDKMSANIGFKLCLKVASRENSIEVIGSSLAYNIKSAGRGYLKVENKNMSMFKLFQSGYSGIEAGNKTQIGAVVDYISEYCNRNNVSVPSDICCPPLPVRILNDGTEGSFEIFPIGIYDDPAHQLQAIANIDLLAGNILLIGSSQTGKTNFLQLIIKGLSLNYGPQEVSFYIADFASMYLKKFEGLKHVGCAAVLSEKDKIKNLFKFISSEIKLRKEKFVQCGLSSFASYLDAGFTDLSQIFFIIDNLNTFRKEYNDSVYDDMLLFILGEGPTCGINTIITNPFTSGLSYRYLESFKTRMAFFCNDIYEYVSLFDKPGLKVENRSGRMLCRIGEDVLEVQTYLAFNGEKEIDRSKNTTEFIDSVNSKYPDIWAKRVRYVPEKLFLSDLMSFASEIGELSGYLFALDYEDVMPIFLNPAEMNSVFVTGSISNKIALISTILKFTNEYCDTALYVFDSTEAVLKSISKECGAEYYAGMSDFCDLLQKIQNSSEITHLLIINSPDALDFLSEEEHNGIYAKFCETYKKGKFLFVFSNFKDIRILPNSLKMYKTISVEENVIVTDHIDNVKCINSDYRISVMRSASSNDSYYITGGEIHKIKIAQI